MARLALALLVLYAAPDANKKEEASLRVLMVVSAATELALADGEPMRVGYWANEVEVPLRRLRESGYLVDIATPGGTRPEPDAVSLPRDPARAKATREAHAALPGLAAPIAL